ncbi:unnamed protein product [Caenorhabditis bovis]|uniref:Ground-like domain-containing protein n=1 Tax=Caenorhabditis bovis TaxID=2654633 RepID=A0A8S1EEI1_9PELO|nr:unnamed protein product [Caenorhabditis bovis]
MILPWLVVLIGIPQIINCFCSDSTKDVNKSCQRIKDARFQIRGVRVVPMWQFMLLNEPLHRVKRNSLNNTEMNNLLRTRGKKKCKSCKKVVEEKKCEACAPNSEQNSEAEEEIVETALKKNLNIQMIPKNHDIKSTTVDPEEQEEPSADEKSEVEQENDEEDIEEKTIENNEESNLKETEEESEDGKEKSEGSEEEEQEEEAENLDVFSYVNRAAQNRLMRIQVVRGKGVYPNGTDIKNDDKENKSEYENNIRKVMKSAKYMDKPNVKYSYPPKDTVPLQNCFYNPSGYVCCNLQLNNVIEEAYKEIREAPDFNSCNLQKIANKVQHVSEKAFEHPFETLVAHADFAQNINFAGDLVCKLEIDGKYLIAYGTPYRAEDAVGPEKPDGQHLPAV